MPAKALGVIPARADSSRFPNKVIAKIAGKPMIQHLWEAAKKAKNLSQVIVATDSTEVQKIVEGFGGKALLTPSSLSSGTDRIAMVAESIAAEIVVNIQGDEPLIPPSAIDKLVEALDGDSRFPIATLAVRKSSRADLRNSNIVKVAISQTGSALYFSRHPLQASTDSSFYKHIGIYAFRKETLMRVSRIRPSALEQVERLEQLRWLEIGIPIKVCLLSEDTIAVDMPEDIAKVEDYLQRREKGLGEVTL